jgi:hypothetical protein
LAKADVAWTQGTIKDITERETDQNIAGDQSEKRRQFLAVKQGTDGMMRFFKDPPPP